MNETTKGPSPDNPPIEGTQGPDPNSELDANAGIQVTKERLKIAISSGWNAGIHGETAKKGAEEALKAANAPKPKRTERDEKMGRG